MRISPGEGKWDLERAGAETLAAMQAGVDVISQATMLEGAMLAGTSRDGSDGTRTRDLRRDRPVLGVPG